MMTLPSPLATIVGGAVMAVVGGAVTVLYFFQPWRTCSYDDTSAGCGMLTEDAIVMTVAMVATVLGVVLVVAGALRRGPTSSSAGEVKSRG